MLRLLDNIRFTVLTLVFLPARILVRQETLFVHCFTSTAIASYLYWPDERWLIFVVCGCITCSFFKTLTDIRSWSPVWQRL